MKRNVFQTENGAGSDDSLPESWSSLNDEKCIDSVRELVNHHKKELAALENELQSKVKSLNEHQSKVDKMEEELMEIAKRQKQILKAEVYAHRITNLRPAQKQCVLLLHYGFLDG